MGRREHIECVGYKLSCTWEEKKLEKDEGDSRSSRQYGPIDGKVRVDTSMTEPPGRTKKIPWTPHNILRKWPIEGGGGVFYFFSYCMGLDLMH